ncbi:MAG: alpha/beta hydrolase [Defluviitaleaceae bacterium]|nr:alpha/beta hydrolase [Defluviitaleaceae bacterium]
MRRISTIFLAFLLVWAVVPMPNIHANPTGFTELSMTFGPYNLYGRLTLPKNAAQPPVAILIQGSGQANYNSAFGGMTIFRDIAHGLAQRGIASVRFNKRYYQHPLPARMTIHDETLDDISYAINLAARWRSLGVVGDIYIIGFSQGGIVAPYVAYHHPQVAGVVSMAGSPRGFFDIVESQAGFLRHQAAARAGLPDGVPVPGLPVGFLLERIMAINENTLPRTYNFLNNQAMALGFPISFLHSVNNLNIAGLLPYIDVPFLILQGSEDLQILADYCFVAWQELFYGRDNATFILYQGLNHFFAPHRPNLGYSQSRARARVDALVIRDIAGWILGDK